jgi:ABC-type molybdate transport system permease subunit
MSLSLRHVLKITITRNCAQEIDRSLPMVLIVAFLEFMLLIMCGRGSRPGSHVNAIERWHLYFVENCSVTTSTAFAAPYLITDSFHVSPSGYQSHIQDDASGVLL